VIEDLKSGNLSYTTVEEFLLDLKKEFGRRDDKIMKVAELKKIEQEDKIMKEFVQKSKRIAQESIYEGRPLVKEFKKSINRVIRQKLMESEYSL